MPNLTAVTGSMIAAVLLAACGGEDAPVPVEVPAIGGTAVAVVDTVVDDLFAASGTAEPMRSATLSTRLMASVISVAVQEGERVAAGQLLVQLDARDLDARRSQVEAGMAEAKAMHGDASAHAARIRGLFADSAATRAQLDQAEAALARATAGVSRAEAMAAEVAATASYAEVRAPFAGVVTARLVDPGAFAAPGSPLVTVEDAATLRVSVQVAPDLVKGLKRGATVLATIGDTSVSATIEGVVRSGSNLYTINALVPNAAGRLLSGSSARLLFPQGTRRAVVVPATAVVRRDDLTGVHARTGGVAALRWVRLGGPIGDGIEVIAGLAPGDSVLLPAGGN
jgi:RND family efflux transporter MFP subunit